MDLPSPPLVETIGITRGAGWLTPIDVDLANLCMFYTRIYQFACKRLNYIYFNNFATSAGIENPRVLGSIPSPGTIFRRTRLWRVFRFLGYGLPRAGATHSAIAIAFCRLSILAGSIAFFSCAWHVAKMNRDSKKTEIPPEKTGSLDLPWMYFGE